MSGYDAAKRVLDVVVAVAATVITLPVMGAIAVVIWCSMGPPALFRQARAGLRGRRFTLLKFRTMSGVAKVGREAVDDHIRLTRVGRFLRRFSLDELPQLWNVLLGEMSLVGPRPLLPEYLSEYTEQQARRHLVKPGITGWAQVNGRNALTWEQRFELDLWYVGHRSFLLDLRILALTVRDVLTGRGVAAEGHTTMPRFSRPSRRLHDSPNRRTGGDDGVSP